MGIRIEGVENVLVKLDGLYDAKSIEKGIERGCQVVVGAAKKKVKSNSKDTGALLNSIDYEVKGTEGSVFTPLEYAPYVEYGTGLFAEKGGRKDVPWRYQDDKGDWHTTSGMHPQPFMRPAVNENRELIMRAIKEGLSK